MVNLAITNIGRWERELQGVKPYLFNLVWQIVEWAPCRQWNIIVCDDTSARLPAKFVQEVFRLSGRSVRVEFLSPGETVQDVVTLDEYRRYVSEIVPPDGRPLFLSESAGTFSAARFVHDLFDGHGGIDFAIVASHVEPPEDLGFWMIGGYGIYLAARHTYRTFEVPRISRRYIGRKDLPQGEILTGLSSVPVPGEPYGHPAGNRRFGRLARYAARRMSELAEEYWQRQGQWHIEHGQGALQW